MWLLTTSTILNQTTYTGITTKLQLSLSLLRKLVSPTVLLQTATWISSRGTNSCPGELLLTCSPQGRDKQRARGRESGACAWSRPGFPCARILVSCVHGVAFSCIFAKLSLSLAQHTAPSPAAANSYNTDCGLTAAGQCRVPLKFGFAMKSSFFYFLSENSRLSLC